jgi:hypothetical protein
MRVFISYSDADYMRGGNPLKEKLQLCGHDVYSFRHKHMISSDFNLECKNQVQDADIVVVLWSDSAAKKSVYIEHEIAFAKSLDKQVILVLLDDIRNPHPLLAREDGIRAYADKFGWLAKVAEQIEVYRRNPRLPDTPYKPQQAPRWLTITRTLVGIGIFAVLAKQGIEKSGLSIERQRSDD